MSALTTLLERTGRAEPSPGLGLKDNSIGVALGIIYLVGIYTHIDLYKDSTVICTAFLCGLSGIPLLIRNRHRVERGHLLGLVGLNATGALTMAISPELSTLYVEEIKGYLQWSYSLTAAYGFYLEATRWPEAFLRKLFGWAIVLVLAGCALEVYTPFAVVSDAFRFAVYNRYIYDFIERDLMMGSHARPKLFTQEPSFVALFLVVSLDVWCYLATTPFKNLYFMIALISGLFLLRSPTLLAALPAFILSQRFSTSGAATGVSSFRGLGLQWALMKLVFLLICSALLALVAVQFFSDRLTLSVDELDQSTMFRLIVPYNVAFSTLADFPFFGIGLGATESIEGALYGEAMNLLGDMKRVNNLPVNGIICNSFCEFLIFFGVMGSSLAFYFILKIIKFMALKSYLYIIINFWFLMNAQGAFVGPRVWTYLMLLLIACRVKESGGRCSWSPARTL